MTLDKALQSHPLDIHTPNLRALVWLHWHGPKYQLAAKLHMHPSTLSAGLRGRTPLKPELITRILVALALEVKARHE